MEQSLELKNLDLVKELVGLVFEYQNKGGGDVYLDLDGNCATYWLRVYDGKWGMDKPKIHERMLFKFDTHILESDIDKMKDLISNIKPFDERAKELEAKELSDKKDQLEKLAKELNVKIVE